MTANEDQIVVYQSDNVERIEVRFDGYMVWLLEPQIAKLSAALADGKIEKGGAK